MYGDPEGYKLTEWVCPKCGNQGSVIVDVNPQCTAAYEDGYYIEHVYCLNCKHTWRWTGQKDYSHDEDEYGPFPMNEYEIKRIVDYGNQLANKVTPDTHKFDDKDKMLLKISKMVN